MRSRSNEFQSIAQWQKNHSPNVINSLINNHKKLIHNIINRYEFLKIDKHALMSEAMLGLLVAAGKYDIKFKVKFTTYAYYWIKAKVLRFIGKETNSLNKKLHSTNCVLQESEMDPDHNDLSTPFCVLKEKHRTAPSESVDDLQTNDPSLMEMAALEEYKKIIYNALFVLSPRELKVIQGRWILPKKLTLKEMAESMGLSFERVRQLERNGFLKIKNYVCNEFGICEAKSL